MNWKVFLDRCVALDHVAGKPVEVRSARAQGVDRLDGVRMGHVARDECLAGGPASEL